MQPKTPKPRRTLHRRQVVAYYRESPNGDDGAPISAQKEIVATWAAENDHEVVEEVIERKTEPRPCVFEMGVLTQRRATRRGDVLYVVSMDVALWHRWRRGEMSLFFHNLSKHPGDRAVFVTADKEIADGLPFPIYFGSVECCCSHGHRIRKALAWRRAQRMGNRVDNGGQPQS